MRSPVDIVKNVACTLYYLSDEGRLCKIANAFVRNFLHNGVEYQLQLQNRFEQLLVEDLEQDIDIEDTMEKVRECPLNIAGMARHQPNKKLTM